MLGLKEHLRTAKGPPPSFVFYLTFAHAVFFGSYYLATMELSPGKSVSLCCMLFVISLDGEVILYLLPISRTTDRLKVSLLGPDALLKTTVKVVEKKINVVYHNSYLHVLWSVVLFALMCIGISTLYTALNMFCSVVITGMNVLYYQPPKNITSWKKAMEDSNECPFAAEARRNNMNKQEFERLRLTFHQ